jgi:hypothetical protein
MEHQVPRPVHVETRGGDTPRDWNVGVDGGDDDSGGVGVGAGDGVDAGETGDVAGADAEEPSVRGAP